MFSGRSRRTARPHHRRSGHSTLSSAGEHFGRDDGWPVRQVEAYDAGRVLRYGPNHPEDRYGGLGGTSLSDFLRWLALVAVWQGALRGMRGSSIGRSPPNDELGV